MSLLSVRSITEVEKDKQVLHSLLRSSTKGSRVIDESKGLTIE
jgi:hypothetical protein